MTTEEAVRIVARYICWATILMEVPDLRKDYPELDERDWARVVTRCERLANLARPDPDAYREAHVFLAARAKGETP